MEDIKKLIFTEDPTMKDKYNVSQNSGSFMKGKVIFRDEEGNILLEKDNLIVLRGRTFALEKLFNKTIDVNLAPNYTRNLNRSICLFKIGTGGTPIDQPFNPFVPAPTDMNLAAEVPFITIDNDGVDDIDTSVYRTLGEGDDMRYYDGRVDSGDSSIKRYYAKAFDIVPEWNYNTSPDEVFMKVTLRIAAKDARGKYINELSLLLASYNAGTNTYTDIEPFSRICFDTESLKNRTKTILIDYMIYA